jgi:hypothetical protein
MIRMTYRGFSFAFVVSGIIVQLLMVSIFAAGPIPPVQDDDIPSIAKAPQFPPGNTTYLSDLDAMRGDLVRFENDARWRDMILQTMGWQFSFVGRYREALEATDRSLTSRQSTTSSSLDTFDGMEACDAVDLISELADERQVIMINEAHHVPMHRVLTTQLLERLHRKGYRYFAVEDFSGDPALQTRGYPTLRSGGLVQEPVFGEMLRTALRLGYQVVAYDFRPTTSVDDRAAHINAREETAAKNLNDRILSNDPQAKILVHVGYGHINKEPEKIGKGEVKWLASAFKELTGIDPLCVDQTTMMERSQREAESREYQLAINKQLINKKPVVLRVQDNKRLLSFPQAKERRIVSDLIVFHPRASYKDGRPTWLQMIGLRQSHVVKTDAHPAKGSSYLAQAFYSNEVGTDTIPVDQMEYDSNEPIPTLWLPNGSFRVRVIDNIGKTLQEYSVSN